MRRALGGLTLVLLGLTVYLGVVVTPPRPNQGGEAVRLLYVHVPAAWIAYLAFGVTAVASILWLVPRTRRAEWDLLAGASAEVGVVFAGLMLVTGSIWGKPTWGTWWEWDARLTSAAILFFLYLGYLALRRTGATAAERGTRCAVAALVAAADIPIVHFSVSWWQTLHQDATVFNRDLDVKISGSMALALVCGVVAYTLAYAWLVLTRLEVARLEEGREERALARAIAERTAATGKVTA